MTAETKSVFFLAGAIIFWGVWGVAEKAAVTRAHVYTVQWMYSIPYAAAIPLWYWLSTRTGSSKWNAGAAGYATLASVASMAALLFFLLAMRDESASVVVAATSAYPIVTLAIAVLSGQEAFGLTKLLGIALVVAGLVVLQVTK